MEIQVSIFDSKLFDSGEATLRWVNQRGTMQSAADLKLPQSKTHDHGAATEFD